MDLMNQLKRQISFIQRSCVAYDQGHKEEALRIAVSLRVLFHDTGNSTSLLTHLGLKDNLHILSTMGTGKTHDDLAKDKQNGEGMICIPIMLSMNGVQPMLDKGTKSVQLSSDAWWNEVVMVQNKSHSRKDVVLAAANQDGGAHVDDNPSLKTRELKVGVGTFTRTINGQTITEDLIDHHFVMIRQFGHEVLNSPELTSIT